MLLLGFGVLLGNLGLGFGAQVGDPLFHLLLREEAAGGDIVLALLDEVEQAARTVKGSERSWQRAGHEYTLWLDGEEVMIRANQLEISGDEIEEGMSYYDEESLSLCGVEDFLQVVAAYREFVSKA